MAVLAGLVDELVGFCMFESCFVFAERCVRFLDASCHVISLHSCYSVSQELDFGRPAAFRFGFLGV